MVIFDNGEEKLSKKKKKEKKQQNTNSANNFYSSKNQKDYKNHLIWCVITYFGMYTRYSVSVYIFKLLF